MFELTGRVALVTGAGRGVGAAIARTFAAQGATVIVNDLAADRAEAVAAELRGGVAAVADVTDVGGLGAAIDAAVGRVGPVDIVVNNAGVPVEGLRPLHFLDTKPDDWDTLLDVGLRGTLLCTRLVAGAMVERGWGRVISVVSDAARVGEPGYSVYAAAKAGVAAFSRSLAKEVGGCGVTVNCLSLGTIEGPLVSSDPELVRRQLRRYPTGRFGDPDDVAPAALWLASEEASWVTGQTISINGGYATT